MAGTAARAKVLTPGNRRSAATATFSQVDDLGAVAADAGDVCCPRRAAGAHRHALIAGTVPSIGSAVSSRAARAIASA